VELWDVYDQDRIKQNRTMIRGQQFSEGDYHLVVHVCIFNSEGQMLIQQRQPFKEGWSNYWDFTVGGSATAGDNSRTAAQRELFEEIGLSIDFAQLRPFLTVNFSHGFDDFYLIEHEVDLDKLVLQYDEVQQVKWATKEEIISLVRCGQFIPYYESLIHLLFDMRKRLGTKSI